jgi:hypothetical protein
MPSLNDFTLVYNTYEKDIEWLRYALLSAKKYINTSNILIYYHNTCEQQLLNMLKEVNINCKCIPVYYDYHGYLKAMVTKCICFNDVITPYVVITDSDTLFIKPFKLEDEFIDERLKFHYRRITDNETNRVWDEAVLRMTKEEIVNIYECNSHPLVFKTITLKEAYQKFYEMHNVDYSIFCKQLSSAFGIAINQSDFDKKWFSKVSRVFYDFEWLGWFIHHFASHDYLMLETPRAMRVRQFRSYGGITPAVKYEIQQYLAD